MQGPIFPWNRQSNADGLRPILLKKGKLCFKMESHIGLTVDGRRVIDWKEDGGVLGGTYGVGRIALRQMKWSWFRYWNFQIRELTDSRSA